MSQRYERINTHGDADDVVAGDDHDNNNSSRPHSPTHQASHPIPSSPPPSFRSRTSSPRRHHSLSDREPLVSDADRNLADAFDAPSDSEDGDEPDQRRLDDRQRVLSGRPSVTPSEEVLTRTTMGDGSTPVERTITRMPVVAPPPPSTRLYGGGSGVDGVFANLSAKPERNGEDAEEKPPTYEQAAADATPPYWENTIFAPVGPGSDDVFIDGLPVGSFFSFIWNGMISTSFQLVGFLLTYLLHSTHAAKNGSKAGLGITLIQYGFSLKGAASIGGGGGDDDDAIGGDSGATPAVPSDPNGHDFDPNSPGAGDVFAAAASAVDGGSGGGATGLAAMGASDWFAYTLMVVGWFVLIRAISEYLKARRHEALDMQSPARGLGVPVVADGEEPAHAV